MAITLPITSVSSVILSGYYVKLFAGVVLNRRKNKVSLGDGTYEILDAVANGEKDVKKLTGKYTEIKSAIRAHGNFSETVPMFLVLLALAEFQQTLSPQVLKIIAGIAIVGRVAHSTAIYESRFGALNKMRPFGMITIYGSYLVLGGSFIYQLLF
ncbi:hypothetical protein HDV01_005454 [Terramyces sp. JEL0728]|nr:hypothetical protein HDV01_005454 [Terramyces sp. JEL0728]